MDKHLGAQWAVDLYGCDRTKLDSVAEVTVIMLDAARAANATIVGERFHHFAPHGVSGVVLIAESHLAIHTWPEHGYAAIDLFSCGDLAVEDAFRLLAERFSASRVESAVQARGDLARITKLRA